MTSQEKEASCIGYYEGYDDRYEDAKRHHDQSPQSESVCDFQEEMKTKKLYYRKIILI